MGPCGAGTGSRCAVVGEVRRRSGRQRAYAVLLGSEDRRVREKDGSCITCASCVCVLASAHPLALVSGELLMRLVGYSTHGLSAASAGIVDKCHGAVFADVDPTAVVSS